MRYTFLVKAFKKEKLKSTCRYFTIRSAKRDIEFMLKSWASKCILIDDETNQIIETFEK